MNQHKQQLEKPPLSALGTICAAAFVLFLLSSTTVPQQAFAQNKSIAASSIPNSRLLGYGTLRWLAFKIYDARLYAPNELASAKNWQTVPLTLELTYARAIKGEQIAQTSADEISRLGAGDSTKIAAWSSAMKQLFPDVKEGDQIVGMYRPNQSVAFFLNGKPLTISSASAGGAGGLGPLSEPSFGKAFFAIWLDGKTRDQGLRKALLGQLADDPNYGNPSNSRNLNSSVTTN
jgi:hypothetical protein